MINKWSRRCLGIRDVRDLLFPEFAFLRQAFTRLKLMKHKQKIVQHVLLIYSIQEIISITVCFTEHRVMGVEKGGKREGEEEDVEPDREPAGPGRHVTVSLFLLILSLSSCFRVCRRAEISSNFAHFYFLKKSNS